MREKMEGGIRKKLNHDHLLSLFFLTGGSPANFLGLED